MILYRLCLTGLVSVILLAAWIIFDGGTTYDHWLLPTITSGAWFCSGAALLNLQPGLNATDRGETWWQRVKFRLRWFISQLLMLVLILLSLNLLFISFRALRLF